MQDTVRRGARSSERPSSDNGHYRKQSGEQAQQGSLPRQVLTEAGELPRIDGVVVGNLRGFDEAGVPLVDFRPNGTGKPLPARATTVLKEVHVGREVALLFEQGDPRKPIVMGLMWDPEKTAPGTAGKSVAETDVEVSANRERVTLTAENEIVLECGKASITLTRAGKVLVRGTYLLNRSSGVNRIKGGSVQIN